MIMQINIKTLISMCFHSLSQTPSKSEEDLQREMKSYMFVWVDALRPS